jgi:hypothetical protein
MKIGIRGKEIEGRIFPKTTQVEYECITEEGIHDMQSLLEAIKAQRSSLEGDDSEELRSLGIDQNFFQADERYLLGRIQGRSSYIPVGKLPSAQEIFVRKKAPITDPLTGEMTRFRPRLETKFHQWEETTLCIIAIAYESEEEVVSNVYIGMPDFAYTELGFPENTALSAAEIMLELGKEKHIYQIL